MNRDRDSDSKEEKGKERLIKLRDTGDDKRDGRSQRGRERRGRGGRGEAPQATKGTDIVLGSTEPA